MGRSLLAAKSSSAYATPLVGSRSCDCARKELIMLTQPGAAQTVLQQYFMQFIVAATLNC